MTLRFDQTGWEPLQPGAFRNADGDTLALYGFDLPPDLPAPLEQLDLLRARIVAKTAESGGGVVELDVITLDGLPAVRQIVKLPLPDRPAGVAYLASFTVPRADRSLVLKLQCLEQGVTGMRDSVAFNHFMTEYGQGRDMQEMMRWWAQHPYTPEVQGGLPRNLSDDPGWDPHFPQHPLSRARRILATLPATIELHPDFKAAPPFNP
ncbi:hypothetical protein [Actinomadura madurae]|uniref:hypothetical protein n=1 Tax=Actinomadura madurae TaxID=1993 RepID=UPI000D9D3A46|nr:hypothetical protein [Actinomadura madurae]SPT60450.1 Uncharacterised protein [Actinomadura madurae]